MRKRETIEPRNSTHKERKPMCSLPQQAVMHKQYASMRRFRRGLRAWRAYRVLCAYPGDLTRSRKGIRP